MLDESSGPLPRPPVRRMVQLIAAATLGGVLLVDVLGPRVYAGENFAAPGSFLAQPGWESGAVGGALPEAILTGRSGPVAARDLRPAVLLLVAPACECARVVRHVVAESDGGGVRVYLVGRSGRQQVSGLAADARGDVVPLVDAGRKLSGTYAMESAAMLVLVRRDGVVVEIIEAVDLELDLRSRLPSLLATP